MKSFNTILVTLFLLALTSCGSVVMQSDRQQMAETKEGMEQRKSSSTSYPATPGCADCFIVPQSGPNRDLRVGYYFDQEEGKCKSITYSTGPGCIPAPFKSLDECKSCCGGS